MISIHRRYESWKFADCETSLLQRAFFFEKSIGSSVNMFATGSVVGGVAQLLKSRSNLVGSEKYTKLHNNPNSKHTEQQSEWKIINK